MRNKIIQNSKFKFKFGIPHFQGQSRAMMTLLFYIYVFLVPLEIYTELIPKGPEGINYANIAMIVLAGWWFLGRSIRGRPILVASPLNLPVAGMLLWIYFGVLLTSLTIPGAPSALDPLGEPFKRYLQFINIFLFVFRRRGDDRLPAQDRRAAAGALPGIAAHRARLSQRSGGGPGLAL